MSTKVDQTSAVEPHIVGMSAKANSSVASTTSPKVSMFAAKTGFVIPKNKLSGSLVPIYRGGKKSGGNNTGTANEDSLSQVQRKTKWGPDLTQDAAVIKGRALAYQTRVDQITQQLKSENLDVGDNEDSHLAAHNLVKRSSDTQFDSEKSETLKIERREAIGEILKLNPSYKAPADYKPLLKEAIVPIPVKEYPGYNFVGLIFGPGSDTKKRLEKETGAKVHVHGIKANSGEKVEISSPDGVEAQDAFEELYVHLSADSYEKVDGAVALIELLVSSISGNIGSSTLPTAVSGNNVSVHSQTSDTAVSSVTGAALNQEVPQLTQAPLQTQFQYHSWFPSVLGPQPAPAAGYNSFLQTSSVVSPSLQPPRQISQPYTPQMHPLGHTGPPRNFLVSNPNPPIQPGTLSPLSFTGSQPPAPGPLPSARPSLPLFPQSAPTVSSRPLQYQQEVIAGSSDGWSHVPVSQGLSNVGQLSVTFATGQSGTQTSGMPFTSPSMPVAAGPPLGSSSHAVSALTHPTAVSLPMPAAPPIRSPSPVVSMGPSPAPSLNPAMVSRPILSQGPSMTLSPSLPGPGGISGSISGNMANFAPINQPAAIAPRHQHGSGDYTFQAHQQHGPASMIPRVGSQAANPHALPPRSAAQQQAPHVPPFQFGVPNSIPQPMQVFPGAHSGNQMGLAQTRISSSLLNVNPNIMSAPPRPTAFPNTGPVRTPTPLSQMGLRNFVPSPQTPNMAGPFRSWPPHSLQLQQHYRGPIRPGNFMPPGPRFAGGPFPESNRPMSGYTPRQQVYDPFSPTSAPVVPQQQGGGTRKPETDAEYEDLMASVGVK